MNASLRFALPAIASLLFSLPGCATHPRDFIPNGAGQNLTATNPAHIQVLDSIPRGSMVIGTILVDRSKAANTDDILAQAKERAAGVGGDFVVWEDSTGLTPNATPAGPGGSAPEPVSLGHDSGSFGHGSGADAAGSEGTLFHSNNAPKARFTVGIILQDAVKH